MREYYRALGREVATPNRRTKVAPSEDDIAAQQRAIKLELQASFAELDERYAFDAFLVPVALAEFHVPGLAIDVNIQRKTAVRTYRLIWNGLLKRIEPLRCSRCGKANTAVSTSCKAWKGIGQISIRISDQNERSPISRVCKRLRVFRER